MSKIPLGLKTKLMSGQIRVYKGTPKLPLAAPALFLSLTKKRGPRDQISSIATLSMARPTSAGYIIKELLADMQLEPEAAVEKAVDIALRGQVKAIYLNANLAELPLPISQTG